MDLEQFAALDFTIKGYFLRAKESEMSFNCLVKFGSFSTTVDRTAPERTAEAEMDEKLSRLSTLCLPGSNYKMF